MKILNQSNITFHIHPSKDEAGRAAAKAGAEVIRQAIAEHGKAFIIVATGASQFEMLSNLVREDDIDWYCVTAFHLDEYVGLPISHPASFRRYLWDRFIKQLPAPLRMFHFLNGDAADLQTECNRVGKLIQDYTIDVAFVGIGENGHLAFNDPPADFCTDKAYIVVELDHKCRLQQFNEGWFPDLESVPSEAITMTVPQIMKSTSIICTVLDERKAEAVNNCFSNEVSPARPASVLQRHKGTKIYLDENAASLLNMEY